MKKGLFLVLGLSLISFFIFGCVPAEKKCSSDDDCVPASCCHASEAVNKAYGPDCEGKLCTAVCEPGTIDCGQGEIRCVEGECKVVLK